jgi:hypothetical protein
MIQSVVSAAAEDIGASAGDDEDAGAATEGAVEGDLVVACEQEFAADDAGDLSLGPVADGIDGAAGEADAGAGDFAQIDAGGE